MHILMMATAWIQVCGAVDVAVLAMAKTTTMARGKRTHRVVSNGPRKVKEQRIGIRK